MGTEKISLNGKIFYKLAFNLTLIFYFIYSVIPSLYALISIWLDVPVFFWMNLETEIQIKLASYQIIGFFILYIFLPKNIQYISPGKLGIKTSIKGIRIISFILFAYTIFPFLEMLFKSAKVSGRVDLFDLSAYISDKYQLKIVFLLLSIFVVFFVFQTKKFKYILFLLPIVSIEFISMGRVWPFAFITILLLSYIHIKQNFIPKKYLYLGLILFSIYSMLRLFTQNGQLDLIGSSIFLLGESFNTQQSIELALHSNSNPSFYKGLLNFISEFLPFGLKRLAIAPEDTATNIIDAAKTDLYGIHVVMGFGSSWVAQFIILFKNNIFLVFYPIILSLSLRLYLFIFKKSEFIAFVYIFFYISNLFMFFRYGFNLSISYPLVNTFYSILVLLFVDFGYSRFLEIRPLEIITIKEK